jgi:hypothetical protein
MIERLSACAVLVFACWLDHAVDRIVSIDESCVLRARRTQDVQRDTSTLEVEERVVHFFDDLKHNLIRSHETSHAPTGSALQIQEAPVISREQQRHSGPPLGGTPKVTIWRRENAKPIEARP